MKPFPAPAGKTDLPTFDKKRVKEQKSLQLPLSPLVLQLPHATQTAIEKTVRILYQMSHQKSYLNQIQTSQKDYLLFTKNFTKNFTKPTTNKSTTNNPALSSSALLMSYDFHIDSEGFPHLIEVNTNAAGFLLADLVFKAQGLTPSLQALKKSFVQEWQDFSHTSAPPQLVALVDEQIPKQKMYVEFLMYQELLNSWGWPCTLQEARDLKSPSPGEVVTSEGQKISMIYNRLCDFYFEKFSFLKQVFLNRQTLISPGPGEYLLLADKHRLCDWCSESFLNSLPLKEDDKKWIQKVVLPTGGMKSLPAEELWHQRKGLFFKPFRGYGGRAVYNGKSITKGAFARLREEGGIYQKSLPAPVWEDSKGTTTTGRWKYDIRAYAYKDQVGQVVARVYQGQVTNFKVPHSGFAAVVFQ